MNRFTVIAMLCMLVACKGKQEVTQTTPPPNAAPSWVSQRPVDGFNYVGIGMAVKDRGDHLEVAKKNALNDLASEIKVKVEGNSLLYTLDRRNEFSEEFTASIRTSTSEELEGYELVDTWENNTEYWNYYRLSKSEHTRLKEERKQEAIEQSKDLHQRSLTSRMDGDLHTALDMDLRALLAIQDYWAEEVRTELNGHEVLLANELFDDLQGLFSNVKLSVLPERCELSLHNGFQREMLVKATGRWSGVEIPLRQLPLVISYQGASGMVKEEKSTDADGHARVFIQNIDPVQARSLSVYVATSKLLSQDLDPTFTRSLVIGMPKAHTQAAIELIMPKVFLVAEETNLGTAVNEGGLSSVLRQEMTSTGFRFVHTRSLADVVLKLRATTRKGGSANGFYTTYLDMNMVLTDARSNEVMNETGEQGIKGVQLNYEKAGMAAYNKARQRVKQEVVPRMMNALL